MKHRIMIVDDAQAMRQILREILDYAGYEIVAECATGEEAVIKYKELKPDLVTMDITMPGKSGIEALSEIIAFDFTAKVIIVTAVGEMTYIIQALKKGAIDYITKPFELSRVINAVGKALKTDDNS